MGREVGLRGGGLRGGGASGRGQLPGPEILKKKKSQQISTLKCL